MMPEHIIIAVSFLGGIIGGMGMGGGTLLIPLLTLCAGLEQHLAQSINLFAFVPMAVAALFVHNKNGYVSFKKALPVTALALIGAAAGSMLAKYAKGRTLSVIFGVFLTVLGACQLIKTIVGTVKNRRKNKKSVYSI